jgi:uroporphyrinogen decarboxylase
MTSRELFQSIMNYEDFDRMPVLHWGLWSETRRRWFGRGLPEGTDEWEVLQAVPRWIRIGVDLDLYPPIEERVIEETEAYRIYRASDGVVQKKWKDKSSIPQYLDFTFKSAEDWPIFKKRLAPHPDRVPNDLDEKIMLAKELGLPVAVTLAPLMGWIRNWMGVENMSFLVFDTPDVYTEIVETLADLTCWGIDQVASRMDTAPDLGVCWEDICYSNGPLVSPTVFERHVAPAYARVRKKLEQVGTKLLAVDCDGLIEPLLGLWLEAGANLHYPVEIGTWNANPMALRKKFGKELRMIGGFNKLALEQGQEAIDAEIERRTPLLKEGGYIIMPDHHITPGTPLENYRYYLDRIRNLRL